jgi:hypothetical protein
MVNDQELTQYEFLIRFFAAIDTIACKGVYAVNDPRVELVASVFESPGFCGTDLEMRSETVAAYYSLSSFMFPTGSIPSEKSS